MRVVAGKYGSRTLKGPRGFKMRPTSDRLRETLFNILGASVAGSVFVDAYAGTGAVGIEALSRGARQVVFLEKHRAGMALIRENLKALGVDESAEMIAGDALKGFERLAAMGLRADFVFLDPPYSAASEYEKALEYLAHSRLLAPGGSVIVEHEKRHEMPARVGELVRRRVIQQGDAGLSVYRRSELPE